MLRVSREDTLVVLSVETGLPYDCEGTKTTTFRFSWNAGSPHFAQLLMEYILNIVETRIRIARTDAYNKGWEDHKAHKAKQAWFDSTI